MSIRRTPVLQEGRNRFSGSLNRVVKHILRHEFSILILSAPLPSEVKSLETGTHFMTYRCVQVVEVEVVQSVKIG